MSFKIPKNLEMLRSIQTESIVPITMNDFDLDRLMAHVYELCAHNGRIKISKTKPGDFVRYVSELANSGHVFGLDQDELESVLQGWLSSAVIKVGQKGKKHTALAMDYVKPISLAIYRSGLPKGRVRSRQADIFIYRAMVTEVEKLSDGNARSKISELIQKAFGEGILLTGNIADEPRYDGSTIDINALLALNFFEQFEARSGQSRINDERPILLPGAHEPIGKDAIDFLVHYGHQTSTMAGSVALSALFGLRLLQLPLRTAVACRELLRTNEWVPDVLRGDSQNPLKLFCDFTQRSGSASDQISHKCVQRDLEVLRQFFTDRIILRSIHIAWQTSYPSEQLSIQLYRDQLMRAVELLGEERMQDALTFQVIQIEGSLATDSEGDEGRAVINELRSAGLSGAQLLSRVLNESLQREGLAKQIQWYWNCGGLTKSYGLLKGSQKARSSWRYAPADDLLLALLAVSFVPKDGKKPRQRMPIIELLKILKDRFGILIDEIPEEFQSSDAQVAAIENRQAFIRRLQLLGCFQGLSDDFAAQYVVNPMIGES